MTQPRPSKPAGWFSGRTRLVTLVSIVVVGIAGATAVSANIGILDQTSDTQVGDLSAAGDLATPSTQVVDVYLPSDGSTVGSTVAPVTTLPSTSAPASTGAQEFAVDVAGTVTVARTDTGVRLDGIAPAAGWSWNLAQSDPSSLLVTLTNGARTFEFTASAAPDGSIAASVGEPIVTATPPAAQPSGGQGEHDDGEHEGEHEGGEDDD